MSLPIRPPAAPAPRRCGERSGGGRWKMRMPTAGVVDAAADPDAVEEALQRASVIETRQKDINAKDVPKFNTLKPHNPRLFLSGIAGDVKLQRKLNFRDASRKSTLFGLRTTTTFDPSERFHDAPLTLIQTKTMEQSRPQKATNCLWRNTQLLSRFCDRHRTKTFDDQRCHIVSSDETVVETV